MLIFVLLSLRPVPLIQFYSPILMSEVDLSKAEGRIQDFGKWGVRVTVKYYNVPHSQARARRFSLFLKFWGPQKGGPDPQDTPLDPPL